MDEPIILMDEQIDGHIQRLDKDLKKFEEELRRGEYNSTATSYHCRMICHCKYVVLV